MFSSTIADWLRQTGPNYRRCASSGLESAILSFGATASQQGSAGCVVAGRLSGLVDPRMLMGVGVVCLAGAMWDMTQWTPDVSVWRLSVVTMIQGAGIAFVFSPLQVVAATMHGATTTSSWAAR